MGERLDPIQWGSFAEARLRMPAKPGIAGGRGKPRAGAKRETTPSPTPRKPRKTGQKGKQGRRGQSPAARAASLANLAKARAARGG